MQCKEIYKILAAKIKTAPELYTLLPGLVCFIIKYILVITCHFTSPLFFRTERTFTYVNYYYYFKIIKIT